MLKKIALGILALIVIIQFIRPEKNNSQDEVFALSNKYTIPGEVQVIFSKACNDCHTNNTTYPWYSNIQPVAWWLDEHIKDGKKHLNFSSFTNLPLAVQYHKFEEIVEEVEEKGMPIGDYTMLGMHPEAKLSEEERKTIIQWADAQMAYMKETYPADSLIRKKKKK